MILNGKLIRQKKKKLGRWRERRGGGGGGVQKTKGREGKKRGEHALHVTENIMAVKHS